MGNYANKTMFNWKQYLTNYKDLADHGIKDEKSATRHWFRHGIKEGRKDTPIPESKPKPVQESVQEPKPKPDQEPVQESKPEPEPEPVPEPVPSPVNVCMVLPPELVTVPPVAA